ncbi:MAG: hypothetical protein MUP45_03470 [Candidatus Marinimicrobia bacterium]|nr:hypothetical protein [Candidatus Neomarinimicrobiota bacterium]
MEKTIIFLPIIIFFGLFGLLILGFFLLVFKLIKKGKASAWEGELVDKKHLQRRDDENSRKINDFFTLVFKTKEGKQIKVGVAKEEYGQWQIGNKGEKKKGELRVRKV